MMLAAMPSGIQREGQQVLSYFCVFMALLVNQLKLIRIYENNQNNLPCFIDLISYIAVYVFVSVCFVYVCVCVCILPGQIWTLCRCWKNQLKLT